MINLQFQYALQPQAFETAYIKQNFDSLPQKML